MLLDNTQPDAEGTIVRDGFKKSKAAVRGAPVFQVKLSLRGASKPPIWRRLLVAQDLRLSRLHDVIQVAMGWTDTHLHAFSTAHGDYGVPDPELDFGDERKARLDQFLQATGDRIRYAYDFGDYWEHDLVLEKVLAPDPAIRVPACMAGRGACPPEDCGGVYGFAELRETLADPDNDEHDAMLEWLGIGSAAEFDPAAFDVAETNELLDSLVVSRR